MTFSAAFTAWLKTPAQRCLLIEAGVKSGGAEITRYLSTSGYVSGATDAPANQLYSGRISGGVEITRRLDLSGAGGSATFGEIELDNTDHALDAWPADIWAGRAFAAYLGSADPDWARADFVQTYAGTLKGVELKSRARVALVVSDILAPLNDTFSTTTVGGAGDNANALVPYCLGECFNVTPVLVDAATQKYSVHNGAIEDILEVRDNGVPVAFSKQLGAGTFTLTNARYGEIRADVQGAKVGGAYRNDAGGLVEWVATSLGNGNLLAGADFDAALLAALRAACTQPVCLYLTGRVTRLSIMQQLAATLGATVTTTGAGKVQIVRLAFGAPSRAIGESAMKAGSFAPMGTLAPQGAFRLAYGRNWSPGDANIAGSVVAASLPILGDEYNLVASSDATVLANYHQNATPDAVDTLFVVQADAQTECDRRQALRGVERQVYGFEGFGELLDVEIGETVTLAHTYFGLSAGVAALVVSVAQRQVDKSVRLEVLV